MNIVNAQEFQGKLLQKKQKQLEFITLKKTQRQYLIDELRRKIDYRDTQLRNFSSRILETVSNVTSIKELRNMATG